MENNSLSHHGIKGQRWGQRRFQNKDGTLTPAGKKRYEAEVAKAKEGIRIQKNKARTQAKLDKLEELKRQARGEKDKQPEENVNPEVKKEVKPKAPKKKTASEMTTEELREAIAKAQLEDQYKNLRPESVPKGKEFRNKIFNEVITPSLVDAGRKQLTNMLNKIGDEALKGQPQVKSELQKLTEKRDKLKLLKEINGYENPKESDGLPEVTNWGDMLKKQTYEKNQRELGKELGKIQKEESERLKAKAKAEAEAQNKSDNSSDDNKPTKPDDDSSDRQPIKDSTIETGRNAVDRVSTDTANKTAFGVDFDEEYLNRVLDHILEQWEV